MSNNIHNQDKKIEKIHKEENLHDENNYDMEETLSDSDLSEEEEEQSNPP
jgi:hypothetical protein